MKIRIIYSLWGGDGFDEPITGGEHQLDTATEEQLRSLAGAEAAGSLEILDCTPDERDALDGNVEADEASQDAWNAAVAAGNSAREEAFQAHLETALQAAVAANAETIAAYSEQLVAGGATADVAQASAEKKVRLAARDQAAATANKKIRDDASWAEGTWHEGQLAQYARDLEEGAPIAIVGGEA